MKMCQWQGTDTNIEQFARIHHYRGTDDMDLGNHTYACMVDHMVRLREDVTLVGQVDTDCSIRRDHSWNVSLDSRMRMRHGEYT